MHAYKFLQGPEGIDIELICASGGTMLYTCFNLPFTQDDEKNDNLAYLMPDLE